MRLSFSVANRWLAIAVLGLWLTQAAEAQEFDAAKLGEIHKAMQKFVDSNDLAGAVTAVGTKQGSVYLDAVGSQSLEKKVPMAKDSLFRIASMTKPITAIGIMILVDEGKLSVDDLVEKHLPEFKGQKLAQRSNGKTILKDPARPITIRDLLTHTSGMPMPPLMNEIYSRRTQTLAEGVKAFSQFPLDFEPGSRWSYCNTGIDTLGRIIEVASGQSYEDFLQKRIFNPLGMKDTTFYPDAKQLARTAETYDKRDGKLVLPKGVSIIGPPADAKYPIPAGGLYSTAEDLSKIAEMMLNQGTSKEAKILKHETVKTMTSNQTGDLLAGFVPGSSFGFGWILVRKPTGVTEMLSEGTFGHGGAFGTQYWIDPKRGIYVIMLIQRTGLGNGDASPMRKAMQAAAVSALK